jgi:hypothetical protein
MKTRTIATYEWNELSDKAKTYARLQYFDECTGLSEELKERTEEALKTAGYTVLKLEVLYSLGYSQGDGVAFNLVCSDDNLNYVVRTHGNYTHAHSMSFNCDNAEGETQETPKAFIDFIQSLSRTIEKEGYAEIEHQQSDEYIKDLCNSNEYEFTDNGRIAPEGVKP